MNIRQITLAAACFMAMSVAAQAACVVSITRTACPGKEKESYSKCNGTKSCNKEEVFGCHNESLRASRSFKLPKLAFDDHKV